MSPARLIGEKPPFVVTSQTSQTGETTVASHHCSKLTLPLSHCDSHTRSTDVRDHICDHDSAGC